MSEALKRLDQTIAKLERAIEDCRTATREAHEATKGLRQAERDARKAKEELEAAAVVAVGDRIDAAVQLGLGMVDEAARAALAQVTAMVHRRFDRIALPLYERLAMLDEVAAARARIAACPGCGAASNAASVSGIVLVEGEPRPPRAGDWNVCEYCACVTRFTGNGLECRELTPAESEEARMDPGIVKAVAQVRARQPAKGKVYTAEEVAG